MSSRTDIEAKLCEGDRKWWATAPRREKNLLVREELAWDHLLEIEGDVDDGSSLRDAMEALVDWWNDVVPCMNDESPEHFDAQAWVRDARAYTTEGRGLIADLRRAVRENYCWMMRCSRARARLEKARNAVAKAGLA